MTSQLLKGHVSTDHFEPMWFWPPIPCGPYGSPKFFVCMDHTLFMRSILVVFENEIDFWFPLPATTTDARQQTYTQQVSFWIALCDTCASRGFWTLYLLNEISLYQQEVRTRLWAAVKKVSKIDKKSYTESAPWVKRSHTFWQVSPEHARWPDFDNRVSLVRDQHTSSWDHRQAVVWERECKDEPQLLPGNFGTPCWGLMRHKLISSCPPNKVNLFPQRLIGSNGRDRSCRVSELLRKWHVGHFIASNQDIGKSGVQINFQCLSTYFA